MDVCTIENPLCTEAVETKKLLNEFCARFDRAFLIPQRKEPFTRAQLVGLVNLPNGTPIPASKLDWGSRLGRSIRAAIAVASHTGFRKAEWTGACARGILNASDVTWFLRGKTYTDPPFALLADPCSGDYLILRTPPSKADPWDAVWGSNPIYLPLAPDTLDPKLCPFRAVRLSPPNTSRATSRRARSAQSSRKRMGALSPAIAPTAYSRRSSPGSARLSALSSRGTRCAST